MGGDVTLHSTHGVGTTMLVRITFNKAKSVLPPLARRHTQQKLGELRRPEDVHVLVAEGRDCD